MDAVIRGARQVLDPVLLKHPTAAASGVADADPPQEEALHGDSLPAVSQEDALAAALRLLEARREEAVAEGLEEGRRRGYDSGYLTGHEEGLRQGRVEAEAALTAAREQLQAGHAARLARWDALLAAAEQKMKSAIDSTEDMLVEIAFESLCKLLGETLAQGAGVRAAVMNVVQRARAREMLVVRVAPDDLGLLHSEAVPQGDALAAMLGAPGVQVLGDARVSLGGCLLETSGGTLDGRLETQLQSLRETLLRTRASAREARP